MIIKNVIVLLDEMNTQRKNGVDAYQAIIESTVSRVIIERMSVRPDGSPMAAVKSPTRKIT